MLADVMTMREHSDKPIHEIKYAFMGDTRNNMGHSLMIVGCLTRHGRAAVRTEEAVAGRRLHRDRARSSQAQSGAKLTITEDPQGSGQRRRLHPHRRVGLDGRAEGSLEGAHRPAAQVPGQHGPDEGERQPAGQVHALPAGVPRHRDGRSANRSPRPTGSRTASKSPTTCSSPSTTSRSSRPRTACTPSRRFSSPHWGTEPCWSSQPSAATRSSGAARR